MRPTLLAFVILTTWPVACSHFTTAPAVTSPALSLEEPVPAPGQTARRVARIAFYHDPLVVNVPPSGMIGQPIGVTVTTYGGGCVGEDTTVVRTVGLKADIVPYQRVYVPPANGACTMELRVTRRQASVVFTSAGLAIVRVIGRVTPGDSLIQVERAVAIR